MSRLMSPGMEALIARSVVEAMRRNLVPFTGFKPDEWGETGAIRLVPVRIPDYLAELDNAPKAINGNGNGKAARHETAHAQ